MQLECFKTLVETLMVGSFSKAAENLFVTQSTVSRRIQFLEDHYGAQLIDRSGPMLAPTEAGKLVFEKATRILSLERDLALQIQETKENPGIRFCCTPAFGIAYLPEIMKRFMLSHSAISGVKFFFELPENVLEGLKNGSFQAGIIEHFEQYDFEGFDTIELPEDELVFISAPKLGLSEQSTTVDDLVRYDLYIRKEGCCSSRLLGHNLKSIGRIRSEFPRTIVCDDLHLIIDTVSEGNGVTFVSRSLVTQQLQQGTLLAHHIPGFTHSQQRTMVLSRSFAGSQLMQDFVQEIRGIFDPGITVTRSCGC